MVTLSKTTSIILAAMLIASVYAFTPLFVHALNAPVASADSFNGMEGSTLTVSAPGVLGNDDDGDGAGVFPLTDVRLGDAPSEPGLFVFNNDGSFSYTATNQDFNGDVTFTYVITDDESLSATGTVTMHIENVDDAPTASNQTISTGEGSATSSVLVANDIDGSDTLTYATSSDPSHGTLALDSASGAFTYTPDTAYTGPDSFTWDVFDGTASSASATVDITVVSAPSLGLSFLVVNSGGVATSSDSALLDGATTTGATTTVSVGVHTVSAIPLTGYNITIGGDCASGGTVSLALGESKHCVLTYTDQSGGGTPALGVTEEKKPANGPISTAGPSFGTITNFSGSVLGASTTLPELPDGCTPLLNGFMRRFDMINSTADVEKLQTFLNQSAGAHLEVTGMFGPETDAAVRAFQTAHADQILSPWGLRNPTGFVYLTTQRWINLMSCSALDIPMPKLVPYHA
jgi:hypothetical protein